MFHPAEPSAVKRNWTLEVRPSSDSRPVAFARNAIGSVGAYAPWAGTTPTGWVTTPSAVL